MKDSDIQAYGRRLFERRESGIFVPPANAGWGEWRPAQHSCHENVSTICAGDSRLQPIRGWLFFDFHYFFDYVRFTAHSVIRNEQGVLYDITPTQASRPYPFIQAEEGTDEFCAFINASNVLHLDYELATKRIYARSE
jgi:hypothetical protein